MVLNGDLLCPDMFLDRFLNIGPALDRGVIGNDQRFPSFDYADPGNDPGGRELVLMPTVCCQWRKFQKGCIGIDQQVDTFAGQEFAALLVPFDGFRRRTVFYLFEDGLIFFEDLKKLRFVLPELRGLNVDF